MDFPREQFDELLGGKEELPSTVSIMQFANARSQEIAALTEAIEDPQNKHLAFQRMPKHLRRRAMSHNVKRMPRRLQEVHLSQMEKSGLPVKGKRPSRKYRRKPCNLLQEYNRRQRKAMWLETHIWHAKRFHMIERWGYKLPNFPNDKSFRACYRATAKHCLVQDLSYLNCIELQGTEVDILQGLNQVTSPECGQTFAAKSSLSGRREGSVVVFHREQYPFQAIGKVTFMWCPEQENFNRTIWIWCHPSFYYEFVEELITVFQFNPSEVTEMDIDPSDIIANENTNGNLSRRKNTEITKLEPKNLGKLPKYVNKNVVMTLMKDSLNRFRLTGPLAQVVLTEAFKFVEIEKFVELDSKEERSMNVDGKDNHRSAWLSEFYKDDLHLSSLKLQCTFWSNFLKDVNSANELPPRMIVATTVLDPRLTMPSSRIKAVNTDVSQILTTIPEGLSSFSPLWDRALRDIISHNKMASAQLNSLRSRALVPGLASPSWLGHTNISHLPLLLVQNPGAKEEQQKGFGSGWDVIVPAGWGMPVWLGLVFRGARPGGLRETERLTLEMASGPTLAPDTGAAHRLSEQRRTERHKKYFRLPPDKRPNYIKLGIVSPFHCPWQKLLRDWHAGMEDKGFYVIRSRVQLDYLNSLLNKTKPLVTCAFSNRDKGCGLVQVGVELNNRGTLTECSMICALGKKDLRLTKDKSGRGPTEPLHEDENEEKRKTQRETHLILLKQLRRKRVRIKRELVERGIFSVKTRTKVSPTEELVNKQAEQMKELWLPSEIKSVKNSSSRCVMGFVTCGDYSFTQSKTFGYGFVALSALLTVLERNQCHCLVRHPSSLQYYFARLKILRPV